MSCGIKKDNKVKGTRKGVNNRRMGIFLVNEDLYMVRLWSKVKMVVQFQNEKDKDKVWKVTKVLSRLYEVKVETWI